jgi:hypothetical protein
MKYPQAVVRTLLVMSSAALSLHCSSGDTSQKPAPPASPAPGLRAQSNGAPSSPSRIPTPAGLRDPRCVHELPDGVTVDHRLNVYENGRVTGKLEPCEPSSMSASPDGLPAPSGVTVNWVESTAAYATTIGGVQFFTKLTAQFTVPSPPTASDNQAIYLFPSFQNSSDTEIIQPVLLYQDPAWTLASWYVAQGNPVKSTSITVHPGDAITASMTLTDGSQAGYDVWHVSATDTTTQQTAQKDFHTTKSSFTNVESGVLESYSSPSPNVWVDGVPQCADYPASNELFGNVSVQQANGRWDNPVTVTPTWGNCINGTGPISYRFCRAQAQNCSFGVASGSTGTTLAY